MESKPPAASHPHIADLPDKYKHAILRWLRSGASLFEMPVDEAIVVQRYVIRDGEPFDEAAYRERHRAGVVRRALSEKDGGVPASVLNDLNIDLTKEKQIMTTKTKEAASAATTRLSQLRALAATDGDDHVWRDLPAGSPVKLYTNPAYTKPMVDLYDEGGNIARKPNLQEALNYIDEKGYILAGASRAFRYHKQLGTEVLNRIKGKVPTKDAAEKKAAKKKSVAEAPAKKKAAPAKKKAAPAKKGKAVKRAAAKTAAPAKKKAKAARA